MTRLLAFFGHVVFTDTNKKACVIVPTQAKGIYGNKKVAALSLLQCSHLINDSVFRYFTTQVCRKNQSRVKRSFVVNLS